MDRPVRVTFGKQHQYGPTLTEFRRCSRHRDGTLRHVPLPQVGRKAPYPSSLKGTQRRAHRRYKSEDPTSWAVWAAAYPEHLLTRHIYEVPISSSTARHQLRDAEMAFIDGKFFHLLTVRKHVLVPGTLVTSVVAMYHESEFYSHSRVLGTMGLIKRDHVCSHYVERYIRSWDVCQAAKLRHVNTARQPRPLLVPDTK